MKIFQGKTDQKLKTYIYKILQLNPDKYCELQNKLIKEIKKNEKQVTLDIINILKKLIKDKIPAKPKFFGLMLIRDLMELKNDIFLNFFVKNLMDRLFKIAQHRSNEKNTAQNFERGRDCLKIYYDNASEENGIFSIKFFTLNLECWKKWDLMFSNDNKKIKVKVDKIRLFFPNQPIYYDYLNFSETDNPKQTKTDSIQNYSKKIQNNQDQLTEKFNIPNPEISLKKEEVKNLKYSLTSEEEEIINENMKTAYNSRLKLFLVVRKLDSKDNFPFKQVPEFHKKIKEQRRFFETFENKIIDCDKFSQQFKNNYFRDFGLTKDIDNLFDDLVENKISLNEFFRDLKVMEYNNKTGTFVSLENFSKIEDDDIFKNFEHDSMLKEEKITPKKIEDFEISFEAEKIEEDTIKEQELKRDRKFSDYRNKNNLHTIMEDSKEMESNQSKFKSKKFNTDDMSSIKFDNQDFPLDVKFDNFAFKNKMNKSENLQTLNMEKSENSNFDIKFDNFNKNDITKPNLYFSHLPAIQKHKNNDLTKSESLIKSKSINYNNKYKDNNNNYRKSGSFDKIDSQVKHKKSIDKLSSVIVSNDFSQNSEFIKKPEMYDPFNDVNFVNHNGNDFDQFDKEIKCNPVENFTKIKNGNFLKNKKEKQNNSNQNKEKDTLTNKDNLTNKKKSDFKKEPKKKRNIEENMFKEEDLMKKENIDKLFSEFNVEKKRKKKEELENYEKNENSLKKKIVESNLEFTPQKSKDIDIFEFGNEIKKEKKEINSVNKKLSPKYLEKEENSKKNIFEDFSKKTIIFEDSNKKENFISEIENSKKKLDILEETFDDKKFNNPLFDKIEDKQLMDIKKENFNNKSNFFDFDDKEDILEDKKKVIKKTIKVEKRKSLITPQENKSDKNKDQFLMELEGQLEKEKIEKSEIKIINLSLKNQCDTLFKRLFETQKQLEIAKQELLLKNGDDNVKNINKEIMTKECEKNIQKRKNEYLLEENRMIQRLNKEIVTKEKVNNLKIKKENEILKELVKQLQLHSENLTKDLEKEKKENEDNKILLKKLQTQIINYNKEFVTLKKSICEKQFNNKIIFENFNFEEKPVEILEKKNFQKDSYLDKKKIHLSQKIIKSKSISIDKKEKENYVINEIIKKQVPLSDQKTLADISGNKFEKNNEKDQKNSSKKEKNENKDNIKEKGEIKSERKSYRKRSKSDKNLNKKRQSSLRTSIKENLKFENDNISEIAGIMENGAKLNESVSMDVYKQMLFNIQHKSKNSLFDEYSFDKIENEEEKRNGGKYQNDIKKEETGTKNNNIKNFVSEEKDVKKGFKSKKKDEYFTEVYQKKNMEERYVDEKLKDYINLSNYPFYKIAKNEIFLKASSLFKNSIIFENDVLSIFCKTETNILRVEKMVSLELTYIPKMENLKITSHILSPENVMVNPPLMIRQFFDRNITQEFMLKIFGDFQFFEFPKLEISITLKNETYYYFIPLPFSINKFVKFQELEQNYVTYFYETRKEILNQKVLLNVEIVDTWFYLVQIFPNLHKVNDNEFLLLVNFGGTSNLLVQLRILSNDLLEFSLFAKDCLPSFFNFAQWFFWIFTL